MCYGNQHGIRAAPLRTRAKPLYQLTIAGVERLKRAKFKALGAANRHRVAGIQPRALQLRDHQELQANRATSDDENTLSARDPCLLHRLHNGVDWLDESSLFEAHIVGQRHDATLGHPRHRFYVLRKSAPVRRVASGETSR